MNQHPGLLQLEDIGLLWRGTQLSFLRAGYGRHNFCTAEADFCTVGHPSIDKNKV